MIKRSVYQVDQKKKQKNLFPPQICVYLMPELHTNLRQELTELKGKTEKSTIIGNFNISLNDWLKSRQRNQ